MTSDFIGLSDSSHEELIAPEINAKAARLRREVPRQGFIGFAADTKAVDVIRSALAPSFPLGLNLQQASFREALEVLRRIPTPETILIDLSGEEQPLTAMIDLEAVVDPGTRVLALGERRDVGFYRSLTRSLGVKEYLSKPLNPDTIARDFLPWAMGLTPKQEVTRGGTIVTVSGVCGGVGSSTVAVNLAWVIGAQLRRHTILLDTDLHTGSAALMLNSLPSPGLRTAIEAPDRIDPLLIERAAQPIVERLHVLAAEEPLGEKWNYMPGAAAALQFSLRKRYNFIIVDIPLRRLQFAVEMQAVSHYQIFVINPTITAIRNLKRHLAAPNDRTHDFRPILVINQAKQGRTISKKEIEQELNLPVVATIPDLPRQASKCANFGEPLAAKHRKFRIEIVAIAHAIGATSEGDSAP